MSQPQNQNKTADGQSRAGEAGANLTDVLERDHARDAFYRGADRGEPMHWREMGPDDVWVAAWNAALVMCENLCAVAEFNGKGANYCSNKIRRKRSNGEVSGA